MTHSPYATAILGALVADAASLGTHWIYDVQRIAEATEANDGKPGFVPVDPENYVDVPAYFAHERRSDGMNTQYGTVLRLALQTIDQNNGRFDVAAYQGAFAETFGAGGSYAGYIDRPTRGTLENIAAEQLTPSGIDDDQLPALSSLPAVIAAHAGSGGLKARVKEAIEVTNVNPVAEASAYLLTDLVLDVASRTPVTEALSKAAENTDDILRPSLRAALTAESSDSVAYGETTGRACKLEMALPLSFHILKHATSYQDAAERNILAGGDNAGRSIVIGTVMGAAYGIEGDRGIPLDWMLATSDAAAVWAESQAIAG